MRFKKLIFTPTGIVAVATTACSDRRWHYSVHHNIAIDVSLKVLLFLMFIRIQDECFSSPCLFLCIAPGGGGGGAALLTPEPVLAGSGGGKRSPPPPPPASPMPPPGSVAGQWKPLFLLAPEEDEDHPPPLPPLEDALICRDGGRL